MKQLLFIACLSLTSLLLNAQPIDQKYQALGGVAKLGSPTGKAGSTVDGKGLFKEYSLNGITSMLIQATATSPAFLLQGEILRKWKSVGNDGGWLGLPTKDQVIMEMDGTEAAEFGGRGIIYWRKNMPACIIKGDIIAKWKSSGYLNTYGWPITDEINIPNYGVGQVFEKASMVWKSADRSIFILTGNEFTTWKASGAQNGAKGWVLGRGAGTNGQLVYEKTATASTTRIPRRTRIGRPTKTMVKASVLDIVKKANAIIKPSAPFYIKKSIDGVDVEIIVPNATDNIDDSPAKSDPQNQRVNKENAKICDVYDVKYYNVTEEQQAFNSGMSIYPGGIYRLADLANGTRSAMASQFINVRKPISLIVPTSTPGATISIPKPDITINDPSNITELNNAIGFFKNQKPMFSNAAEIHATFSDKETTEEARIAAGATFGGWGATLSSQFKDNSFKKYKLTVIEFVQPYFSINADETSLDADIRTNKNAWFKTPQNLSKDLVYVASCTYGRRGYLFVESSYTSKEIELAVNASYSGYMDAKGNFDYKSKNVVNSLNIKGVIMGGNAKAGAEAVQSIEKFKQFITSGATYDANNQPVLLSYSLAFLDGQTAKVVTTANPTISKCRPLNPILDVALEYIHTDGYPISALIEVTPCKMVNGKGVAIGPMKQLCNVNKITANYLGKRPDASLNATNGNPIATYSVGFTNEEVESGAYLSIFYKLENGKPMVLYSGKQTNQVFIKDLLSKPDFFYDNLTDGKNVNVGWTIRMR